METRINEGKWQFWIDRGGTFTDVVALNPQGEIIIHKLLSENPEHYQDSGIEGIRVLSLIMQGQPIFSSRHFWTGSTVIGLLGLNGLIGYQLKAGHFIQ